MNKVIKKAILGMGISAIASMPLVTTIACNEKSKLNPEGTLVIARWGNEVEAKSQQVAISDFEKIYNTKVKILTLDYGKRVEQISKWAAAGSLPDIIETDGADFSNYAAQSIIKKVDPTKIKATTISGLVPQALQVMVGNVNNGKWTYGQIPSSLTQSSFIGANALWGVPKEFNTLGVYINKNAFDWTRKVNNGDPNAGTYQNWKDAWENSANKTNSSLLSLLKRVYNNGNGLQTKKDHLKGPLSFTNDPNRFTQLFSDADYNKFKTYNSQDIKENKAALKVALKKWWTPLREQYLNVNKEGGALTSQKHGYGWNGEAFNKKAVGAVIEGAWFTPSNEVYQASDWDIWTAPTPGLFPQGWALSQGSNDDDLAHKFMSYMASESGAGKETSLTGALPGNKAAFVTQYKKAIKSGDTTFTPQLKKKIINHSKGFMKGSGPSLAFDLAAKARPLLFTSEYPLFQKVWFDTLNPMLIGDDEVNQAAFNSAIDKIVDGWVTELEDLS